MALMMIVPKRLGIAISFHKGSGEKELLFMPVWMFWVESQWKDDLGYTYQRVDYMAVNAETGEICGEPQVQKK